MRHFAVISTYTTRCLRQSVGLRFYCQTKEPPPKKEFDIKMLDHIVCPLSKGQLRYEASTNELISDELGVAYPIRNGIPNLIPHDARKLNPSNSIERK